MLPFGIWRIADLCPACTNKRCDGARGHLNVDVVWAIATFIFAIFRTCCNLLVCFVVMHYLGGFLLFIIVCQEELHDKSSTLSYITFPLC